MNGYYQSYCEKGLDDYIIFCGNVENIYNVFYQADIFVSSSIYEGLPRAHIEALLCECPIVSTDIPGSNEVVLDGVNGILVPPKDSKTLNKALYQLLKSNGLRKKFRKNGLNILNKNFEIKMNTEKLIMLYKSF